eukprot:1295042-Rhodomonas_salina.1
MAQEPKEKARSEGGSEERERERGSEASSEGAKGRRERVLDQNDGLIMGQPVSLEWHWERTRSLRERPASGVQCWVRVWDMEVEYGDVGNVEGEGRLGRAVLKECD